MNPPTEHAPLLLACTRCGDAPDENCPECHGKGPRAHAVTRCPCESIPSDVSRAVEFFRYAEQGNLPAPGAVLEQTQSFMDGWQFWRIEKAMCGADE